MSFDLAAQVLKATASLHATGYHFLQTYPNGVQGFLKDHPDFNCSGWLANENNPTKLRLKS